MCARLQINQPQEKPSQDVTFKCSENGCNYAHKQVSLNAYVLHVQREHNVKLSSNLDMSRLLLLLMP